MERTPVIIGLSRQAKMYGLPMPYFMAVGGLSIIPFIWTSWLPWLLTIPFWYLAARAFTIINPHGHRLVTVIMKKSPPRLTLKKYKRFRRYV